jgi:mannose-6-phosphate isomerase-like protein (cupin superfamily)
MKRRNVLALTALSPFASQAASTAPAAVTRRVVTTTDSDGKTQLLMDGAPPVAFELNGSTITRLWESPGTPVPLPLKDDTTLSAGNAYREEFVGSSLYFADLPAGSGGEIPLHRNLTLDYIAVMSGEVTLVMPDQRMVLTAGDVLVQGGTLHRWENFSDQPCRLLVVVLTGTGTD